MALESSKKAFKDSHKIFDQKVLNFEKEIIKLNDFKTEKLAEEKKIKKQIRKADNESRKMILPKTLKSKRLKHFRSFAETW